MKQTLWTGLFLRDGLFEIGPLDRFLSKDRFSKSAPWIGLFPQIGFLKSALWIGLFLRNGLFEIGTFLCDGPIGMVRYVSEVCQVM